MAKTISMTLAPLSTEQPAQVRALRRKPHTREHLFHSMSQPLPLLILLLLLLPTSLYAQKHFGVHSYGANVGRYSPSLDAWQGSGWEFAPATMLGIDMDLDVARQVRLRVSAGGGSTSALLLRDPDVGDEELHYRFLPLGSTVMVHTASGFIELYGGAGLDLMRIRTTYESSTERSEINGSTFLPHVMAGVRVPVSGSLSLSFQVRQVLGTYDQQFLLEADNNVRVTQPILMQGLHWGAGIRVMVRQ